MRLLLFRIGRKCVQNSQQLLLLSTTFAWRNARTVLHSALLVEVLASTFLMDLTALVMGVITVMELSAMMMMSVYYITLVIRTQYALIRTEALLVSVMILILVMVFYVQRIALVSVQIILQLFCLLFKPTALHVLPLTTMSITIQVNLQQHR